MNDNREATVIALAKQTRERCVCQEEPGAEPCECPAPITRAQVGRLEAYALLHPERVIACSELADEWMAVLHASLPPSEDPILAWLQAPFDVPPAAELHHAADLDALLDTLGAPPAAIMS